MVNEVGAHPTQEGVEGPSIQHPIHLDGIFLAIWPSEGASESHLVLSGWAVVIGGIYHFQREVPRGTNSFITKGRGILRSGVSGAILIGQPVVKRDPHPGL